MIVRKIGISFAVLGTLLVPVLALASSSDNDRDISCSPSRQTVDIGERVTFTASGGSNSSYRWIADGRTYSNEGRTFTTEFDRSGTERVTVRSGSDSDYCTVTVTSRYYGDRGYFNSYYPNSYGNQYYRSNSSSPNVALTVVSLPNTGFEPQSVASIAFALLVLLGIGWVTYPYVRKAFTAVLR